MHPARVRLNLAGVSVSRVASMVGLSTGAVSLMLAGTSRLRDDVREAIVELVGDETAAEIIAAIPERDAGERQAA